MRKVTPSRSGGATARETRGVARTCEAPTAATKVAELTASAPAEGVTIHPSCGVRNVDNGLSLVQQGLSADAKLTTCEPFSLVLFLFPPRRLEFLANDELVRLVNVDTLTLGGDMGGAGGEGCRSAMLVLDVFEEGIV